MFRIVRKDNPDEVLSVFNAEKSTVKIGRDVKTCGIALDAKAMGVSREHAEIRWNGVELNLTDSSSFGTIINGTKIVKATQRLHGGEEVKIGHTVMLVIKEERRIAPIFARNRTNLSQSSVESQPMGRVVAAETPLESMRSTRRATQRGTVASQTTVAPRGRSTRLAARKKNPLVDSDEEAIMEVEERQEQAPSSVVLATETMDDDGFSFLQPSRPLRTQPSTLRTQPADSQLGSANKKKSLFFSGRLKGSSTAESCRPLPSPLTQVPLATQPHRFTQPPPPIPSYAPVEITIDDEDVVALDKEVEEVMSMSPVVKRRKTSEEKEGGASQSQVSPLVINRPVSVGSVDNGNKESLVSCVDLLATPKASVRISKKRSMPKMNKKEEDGPPVDDLTLDPATQSQIVEFSDGLVRSQDVSQIAYSSSVVPRVTGGFKKFRKARQGRFYSSRAATVAILGGSSDLVDFREIRI